MFDELASKLAATLTRLTGRGVLSEDAVREGLREIRRVLLEADVSFDLTRGFLERVEAEAVGQQVIKSVRPGQQLVKIVYDELVAMLGERQAPLAHATVPPPPILVVRRPGSLAAPAAQAGGGCYRDGATEGRKDGTPDVVDLVRHGIEAAGKARARTVLVDTAGRLQIDEEMMAAARRPQGAL